MINRFTCKDKYIFIRIRLKYAKRNAFYYIILCIRFSISDFFNRIPVIKKTDIETKRFIFKNKCIPVKNNYDQISS